MRESLTKGDVKAAQEQFRATVSALDKSVQKGVLHKNTVSRYKSRLNARLKTLVLAPAAVTAVAPVKAKAPSKAVSKA
jgi:small subunit ribosomal protein S20